MESTLYNINATATTPIYNGFSFWKCHFLLLLLLSLLYKAFEHLFQMFRHLFHYNVTLLSCICVRVCVCVSKYAFFIVFGMFECDLPLSRLSIGHLSILPLGNDVDGVTIYTIAQTNR